MSDREFTVVEAIIALLVLLLVAALALFALAIAYPRAAEDLGARLASGRPWVATTAGDIMTATDRVLVRAQEGWRYRVARPIARYTGRPEPSVEPVVEEPVEEFPVEECEQCHPGFFERPLFSVVFAPHETHEAAEIGCERCHAAEGPERDRVPPMSGCGDCHAETQSMPGCLTCHPYGSLFHGARLAGDREIGMACETCHTEERLVEGARPRPVSDYDPSAEWCALCHETAFCDSCHPAAHPPGYGIGHIPDFKARRAWVPECHDCHLAGWCAMRCHAR